jgi:hypothetical protein
MKIKTIDLLLLIVFSVFIIAGISKSISADFIIRSHTLRSTLEWCGIPTLIVSSLFAYRATFGYRNKSLSLWGTWVGCISLFIIAGILSFLSFEGLLIGINQTCGKQRDAFVDGKIIRIEHPRREKPLNSYTIYIHRESFNDTVKMEVPRIEWEEGQFFCKSMKKGSLGLMYSDK